MTPRRPVCARAILTAFSIASAPVVTKIDFFLLGPGRQLVQFLGETHRAVVRRDHDAGVAEAVDLLGDRGGDLRVAMASRTHRDAGAEVDVTIAFDVPQFRALCARNINRGDVALAAGDGVVLACLPVLVGEPGKFGDFQFSVTHLSIPPMHMYLISV